MLFCIVLIIIIYIIIIVFSNFSYLLAAFVALSFVFSILCLQGTVYSTLPYSAYDLFLTEAINDGIKLWDLRTQR